jgi:hypothetical protein
MSIFTSEQNVTWCCQRRFWVLSQCWWERCFVFEKTHAYYYQVCLFIFIFNNKIYKLFHYIGSAANVCLRIEESLFLCLHDKGFCVYRSTLWRNIGNWANCTESKVICVTSGIAWITNSILDSSKIQKKTLLKKVERMFKMVVKLKQVWIHHSVIATD